MKTVTAKVSAWLSPHSRLGPKELASGECVHDLSYFRVGADMGQYGYTRVGEAEITVTLVAEKALIDNKVEALRAEAANIRAEATAKVTRIESQIQNLLAISFDPTSTGSAA